MSSMVSKSASFTFFSASVSFSDFDSLSTNSLRLYYFTLKPLSIASEPITIPRKLFPQPVATVIAIDLPLRRLSLLCLMRHSLSDPSTFNDFLKGLTGDFSPGRKVKLPSPLLRPAILNLFSAPRSFLTTRPPS